MNFFLVFWCNIFKFIMLNNILTFHACRNSLNGFFGHFIDFWETLLVKLLSKIALLGAITIFTQNCSYFTQLTLGAIPKTGPISKLIWQLFIYRANSKLFIFPKLNVNHIRRTYTHRICRMFRFLKRAKIAQATAICI